MANCETRQLIKGVAHKGGRGVFQGKIIVDQVALTMLQNPLVSKWLVAVSAKKKAGAAPKKITEPQHEVSIVATGVELL